MPDLTVSVTLAQANRIAPALAARYVGTSLATAPLGQQARDFLMAEIRAFVQDYERRLAVQQAQGSLSEF